MDRGQALQQDLHVSEMSSNTYGTDSFTSKGQDFHPGRMV